MSKKNNKSKKVNSISSTKKMNENNIKDIKDALDDEIKREDIEDVIQRNIESKIENISEIEESIIIEQEAADTAFEEDDTELIKQDFCKHEILEKIKHELKRKKKENSKNRRRKLVFINFIVGAVVELFLLACFFVINIESKEIINIIDVASLAVGVIIALTLFELSYLKKRTLYFVYAIETFAIIIVKLLIMNTIKSLDGIDNSIGANLENATVDIYNLFIIVAASVAIYYIIRAFVVRITHKNVDDMQKK